MTPFASAEYTAQFVVRCLAHLFKLRDIPVYIGAACGAAIFIMNILQTDKLRRAVYFLISFFLGSDCAESAANLLHHGMEKIMHPAPQINKTFTAALTAATVVRLIIRLSNILLNKLNIRK